MAEVVNIKKDEFLFEQDDIAECMYIVKSGKISLQITDGISKKEIDTVSPGQLLGEMSLFDKRLRSASAIALVESSLIKLPYKKLESELETMPEWVQAVLKKLSEKIREANTKILTKESQEKAPPKASQ